MAEVIVGKCGTKQRLALCYEESREPDKFDSLIYHVGQLYRSLAQLDISNSIVEYMGTSLSLIQEIGQSQSVAGGFTPSVLRSGSRVVLSWKSPNNN